MKKLGFGLMRLPLTDPDNGASINMPEFEALQGDISTNVLIIGGGITGILSAYMLAQANVEVLICGGIGMGAQNALAANGIKVYGGVSGYADGAVQAFLVDMLDYNPNVKCSHHDHEHGEGHTCGDHGCGNH